MEEILGKHLKNELQGVESEVKAQFDSMDQAKDIKAILDAPDAFMAAAVLTEESFYMGKGDRTKFFEFVLNSDPSKIPDLGKKIRLITAKKIGKHNVYNDKNCAPERLNKHTIFKIWLHTVRRHKCVTLK